MQITHIVSQGECLLSIASQYGIADWRRIYDHEANAEFRRLRPNPNCIYPGDTVIVPAVEIKEYKRPSEKTHVFKVPDPPVILRIALRDEDDAPLASRPFKLTVGKRSYPGKTNSEGILEQEIPATATRAILQLPREGSARAQRWTLLVGYLDPIQKISGVQARLNNLGYSCGPVDGIAGQWTRAALRSFQREHGLDVTGEPNQQSLVKLVSIHDH